MNDKNKNLILTTYILAAVYISTAYHYIKLVQKDLYLSLVAAVLMSGLLAYLISANEKTRKYTALALTIFLILSLLHLLPEF